MFQLACLGGVHELPIVLLLGVLIFGRALAKLCGLARSTAAPTDQDTSGEIPLACAVVESAPSQHQSIHEHVSA